MKVTTMTYRKERRVHGSCRQDDCRESPMRSIICLYKVTRSLPVNRVYDVSVFIVTW